VISRLKDFNANKVKQYSPLAKKTGVANGNKSIYGANVLN